MTQALINMVSLSDKVSERIRASFVELIPEETWKQLVEKEIKAFVNDDTRGTYYPSDTVRPAPLKVLIREELEKRFKAKLAEELNKPEYQTTWDNNRDMPGETVQKIIKDSLPELAILAMNNAINQIMSYIRSGAQRMG